ncbi:hypothetical protein [Natronoarchaeum rubrum]|uniref:hypothetical protein n=1 Tax=Natronoarchaeum rubrum TaxID=755311 RepID=UPI002112E53B|nr:hypothetical protein [Natronoarchaeum rubrum]
MSSSERSGDADATPDNARATQEDAEAASGETGNRLHEALDQARMRRRSHAVALAGAAALGLVFAWLHWLGLVLGGALVALVAPSIRRGVAYALAFGVLVLVAFAVAIGDAALLVPEMRPIVYVTVGAAIGLPLFGSLARGIV